MSRGRGDHLAHDRHHLGKPGHQPKPITCSFCGLERPPEQIMVGTSLPLYICLDCARLAVEILTYDWEADEAPGEEHDSPNTSGT